MKQSSRIIGRLDLRISEAKLMKLKLPVISIRVSKKMQETVLNFESKIEKIHNGDIKIAIKESSQNIMCYRFVPEEIFVQLVIETLKRLSCPEVDEKFIQYHFDAVKKQIYNELFTRGYWVQSGDQWVQQLDIDTGE